MARIDTVQQRVESYLRKNTQANTKSNLNRTIPNTTMPTEVKQILHELKSIKEEIQYIKTHMVDADTILTSEEKQLLIDSLKNEKTGKGTRLEDLKNVRNSAR